MPGLLALIEGSLPSGRYRARELAGVACVSALELPVRAGGPRATGGTRRGPRRRRAARRDAARSARSSTPVFAIFHTSCPPATCSSSTSRRRCRLRSRPASASEQLQLRLSTPTTDGGWVVELRTSDRAPHLPPPVDARLDLAGGAHAELVARFAGSDRLAVARFELDEPLEDYLRRHGQPIRYGHVPEPWPLAAYQTVFALEPGSAEMPSAGRPFTAALVTELVARGVLVAPVTLHTGLSSPERGEPPFPERYHVPAATAQLVNAVHGWDGRVIAVGTTVVRALETVAAADGTVSDGRGLDESRGNTRARAARDRRPPHRVSRTRVLAPRAARSRGRCRSRRALLRGRARRTATSGTSSATST